MIKWDKEFYELRGRCPACYKHIETVLLSELVTVKCTASECDYYFCSGKCARRWLAIPLEDLGYKAKPNIAGLRVGDSFRSWMPTQK